MTPAAFRAGRNALGLTQKQLAMLMGYGCKQRITEIERPGRDAVPFRAGRLMEAYLQGYRPPDWPR